MSDLRSSLIKLAHANPELRGDILPLLKEAGEPWFVYVLNPKDNAIRFAGPLRSFNSAQKWVDKVADEMNFPHGYTFHTSSRSEMERNLKLWRFDVSLLPPNELAVFNQYFSLKRHASGVEGIADQAERLASQVQWYYQKAMREFAKYLGEDFQSSNPRVLDRVKKGDTITIWSKEIGNSTASPHTLESHNHGQISSSELYQAFQKLMNIEAIEIIFAFQGSNETKFFGGDIDYTSGNPKNRGFHYYGG